MAQNTTHNATREFQYLMDFDSLWAIDPKQAVSNLLGDFVAPQNEVEASDSETICVSRESLAWLYDRLAQV